MAQTGIGNTALPTGWALSETGISSRNDGGYAASAGSESSGDTYSYGSSGSTDRAFAMLRSGALDTIIGASLTNDTGATITSLDVAYTGEEWRLGVANRGQDRIDFQWSRPTASRSAPETPARRRVSLSLDEKPTCWVRIGDRFWSSDTADLMWRSCVELAGHSWLHASSWYQTFTCLGDHPQVVRRADSVS